MKRQIIRNKSVLSKGVIGILICILMTVFLTSCGTKFIRKGKIYPRYTGEIRVYWKEHGVPVDRNSYEFLGTVSGRSTWCGVAIGRDNQKLHGELTKQAGIHGGNGIILYCGELGTTGECYCYGDVIRFK